MASRCPSCSGASRGAIVGRPHQQVVAEPVCHGGEAAHRTRHHDHAVGAEGSTGDGRSQIAGLMHMLGNSRKLNDAVSAELMRDCRSSTVRNDQVRLNICGSQLPERFERKG